jgi:hypothetical protein
MKVAFLFALGLLGLAGGLSPAAAAGPEVYPEPDQLPAHPALPDPLITREGRPVTTAAQWNKVRRPELKALFQHYMYGHLPPAPRRLRVARLAENPRALGGRATLREVRLSFGPEPAPRGLNLLILTPNDRPGPVPVILGLNFCGNHAVLDDPAIALPAGWMPQSCPGCVDHRATEAGRGGNAGAWDVAQVLARGYALATFYHGDLEPDYPDAPDGIRATAAAGGWRGAWKRPERDWRCPACPERYQRGEYDWGTIAAWAWGCHRAVDYLVTDRRLDRRRIAVYGHSRNGKTALLAAALDERIGLVLCHQAGCGGSAPSRGKVGESVRQINDRFPHWFNAAFKRFNDTPERLPFDQHELIALCAPRPVLLSNATEDQWANPAGQFEMLRAADPVYRLLGVPGLADAQMPPVGQLSAGRLGYFIRPGKHSVTPEDWRAFLDFADHHWARGPRQP